MQIYCLLCEFFLRKQLPVSFACLNTQLLLVHIHFTLNSLDDFIPFVRIVPSSRLKCQISLTRAAREEEGDMAEMGARGRKEVAQRQRERWGSYLWEDGAGNGGWRNHLVEKSEKKEAIRKLKGPSMESGYLEPDWKHSAVSRRHPRVPQAPSTKELTKEEAAAVNSLFRWSLAKRDVNMKSTGYQSFSYRTEVAAFFSFSFVFFSPFLETKWHLKLILAMNASKKHFKELTISRSAATFDKDIFGHG